MDKDLCLWLDEDLCLWLDVDLGLRLNNDFSAHVVYIFGMENRSDHQMTRMATGKPELDTIFTRTSSAEETKSHVGMTKRLAIKEILVTNFNPHILC